jgi:tetratricopeptide (TPR) repeat protein
LQALGRFDEADHLCEERLKRLPEDLDAVRALVSIASGRRDYRKADVLGRKLQDSGRAEAVDLNNLAWNTLFFDRLGGPDIESAIKSSQLSQNSTSTLHTLGCLYAEVGKTKEAREVLLQAMDLLNLEEPNSDYWYAFGRIAEQFGESNAAKAMYAKVTKPKEELQVAGSSYSLAQVRVAKLISPAKEGTASAK